MRTLWISLLAVSLLMSIAPLAPAKAVSFRMPYDGPAVVGHTNLAGDCSGDVPQSIGVVCLAIPKGASIMKFNIDDASKHLSIGGTYYLYKASGEFYTSGSHCGETQVIVPSGGTAVVRLDVFDGPTYCTAMGQTPGEATKGYISFRLR